MNALRTALLLATANRSAVMHKLTAGPRAERRPRLRVWPLTTFVCGANHLYTGGNYQCAISDNAKNSRLASVPLLDA